LDFDFSLPYFRTLHNILFNKMGGLRLGKEAQSKYEEARRNSDLEGNLEKKGAKRRNWNTRWFTLKDNYLFYSKNKSSAPQGIINLHGCTVSRIEGPTVNKPNCFSLLAPKSVSIDSKWTNRTYVISGRDQKEVNHWMEILSEAGKKAVEKSKSKPEPEKEESDEEKKQTVDYNDSKAKEAVEDSDSDEEEKVEEKKVEEKKVEEKKVEVVEEKKEEEKKDDEEKPKKKKKSKKEKKEKKDSDEEEKEEKEPEEKKADSDEEKKEEKPKKKKKSKKSTGEDGEKKKKKKSKKKEEEPEEKKASDEDD